MNAPLSFSYKNSANIIIYRDGGSLELIFTADDDKSYCIFMEVVHDSPNDCKRYKPPMLFKDSFDTKNNDPQSFIDYITWIKVRTLIDEMKRDVNIYSQKHRDSSYFDLVESIANNNGWLIN